MSRAAQRGEAIRAFNRWGHKRPRSWLVKYGGIYAPECHVLRDMQETAKAAVKGNRTHTPNSTTNDPRMLYAP